MRRPRPLNPQLLAAGGTRSPARDPQRLLWNGKRKRGSESGPGVWKSRVPEGERRRGGRPEELASKELSILPLRPGRSRCPSSDPVQTRLSPGGLGEVLNEIRRAGSRGAWNHSWLQSSVPLSVFHQSLPRPAPLTPRPVQAPTQHPQTPASPCRSGTPPPPDSQRAATSSNAALRFRPWPHPQRRELMGMGT